MAISAGKVKELREKTGAGMMDCKKVLEETGGDFDKAVSLLREKGVSVAAKRESRAATEGTIAAYIHHGSQIGVMVELNCETAPVAKTDEFKELARDIAMQIAWSNPDYISREEVPEKVLAEEKEIQRQRALKEGKPEHIVEKMVEGRMKEFYQKVCLLDQPFVKNDDVSIKDLINEIVGRLGEKIMIGRFCRYRVGELG